MVLENSQSMEAKAIVGCHSNPKKKYRAYKKKQRFFEVCEFRKKQKMHQKYKSAKIIQRYARGSAVYKQFTLKKKGVLRLQSIVRGIIARKRSSKLLVEARMRVQKKQ